MSGDGETIETDLGWAKIWARIKEPIDLVIEDGYFDEAEATKAATHDLGLDDAPETAFVRKAWDDNIEANIAQAQRLMGKVVDGDLRVGAVGLALGRSIQSQIRKSVDREGLVDTGSMRDATGFRYALDGRPLGGDE